MNGFRGVLIATLAGVAAISCVVVPPLALADSPDLTSSVTTVVNLSGHDPAQVGDLVQYTINHSNVGAAAAVATVAVDRLPVGVEYLPGSLVVTGSTGSVPLTDQAGDDAGEVVDGTVKVRLGAGADSSGGGRIEVGESIGYRFRVRLTAEASGRELANQALVSFTNQAGQVVTYQVAPAKFTVAAPADLVITKTLNPSAVVAGEALSSVIAVVNNGPGTATGVVVRDWLAGDWQDLAVDLSQAPGAQCDWTGPLVCALPDLVSGEALSITLSGQAPTSALGSLSALAALSATTHDPDLTNNVSAISIGAAQQADLVISLSPVEVLAAPGDLISYSLTVTNQGPSDAADLIVTDLVSPLLRLVSAESEIMDCFVGGSASCALTSLAVGNTASVTVIAQLDPDAVTGVGFENLATVVTTTPDSDYGNNTATASGAVGPASSDVRLTQSASPVVAGGRATYTLTAVNHGPSDATGVVVADAVPNSLTITNATTDRGRCSVSQGVVSCQVGALPAGGATATITIAGQLDPAAQGSLANTATVTSASADPDTTNNSAATTTDITNSTDLSVVVTADKMTLPNYNDQVGLTIAVRNDGPSLARGVEVGVQLPAGLVLDPDNPPELPGQGPSADAIWTYSLGDLAIGDQARITVHTVSTQQATEPMTVAVSATTSATSLDQTPVTATWTLSDLPQADLSVTASVLGLPKAGQTATYQLMVANAGPNDVVPTVVSQLPAGVYLIPAGSPGSGTTEGCVQDGSILTCSRPDALVANQAWTVFVSVAISADFDDGVLAGTVSVQSDLADPSLGNNQTTVATAVAARADVAVTDLQWVGYVGVSEPGGQATTEAARGSYLWLTATLTNAGPATAKNVSVLVSHNLELIVKDGQPVGASGCTPAHGELACPLGQLAPGESVDWRLLLAVPAAATAANAVVQVSTTTPGDEPLGNTSQASLSVSDGQSKWMVVSSQVTGDSGALVAGSAFSHTISLGQPERPDGLWEDVAAVVTEQLPPGFRATSAISTHGSCQVESGNSLVRCQVGTEDHPVAAKSAVTITVFGVIGPDVGVGEAVLTTQVAAPRQAVATSSTTVSVSASHDLQLFMVADSAIGNASNELPVFHIGATIGYTLTVLNAGPSVSPPTTITDTLPFGASLAAGSPDCVVVAAGGPAAESAEVVTCAVGSLQPGQAQSLRLMAATSPDSPDSPDRSLSCGTACPDPQLAVNTAQLAHTPGDPNPDNDATAVSVELAPLADLAVALVPESATPLAASQLRYRLTLSNHGPSVAEAPRVDLHLPPGLALASWQLPTADCTTSGDPVRLSCAPTSQTLLPGQALSGTITVNLPLDPANPVYYLMATTAAATATDYDSDNAVVVGVAVRPVSDTVVTAQLADEVIRAGQPATVHLSAHNHGPSTAKNLVVDYHLPSGLSFVTGDSGCTVGAADHNVVRCHPGDLPVGADATIKLSVVAADSTIGQSICGNATVASNSLDPNDTDNQAALCQVVAAPLPSEVKVAVGADQGTVAVGSQASFTVVISNTGPGVAADLTAVFNPSGLSAVAGVLVSASTTTPETDCHLLGQQLICTVGDLGPGQSAHYQVTGIAENQDDNQAVLAIDNLPADGPIAAVVIIGPP